MWSYSLYIDLIWRILLLIHFRFLHVIEHFWFYTPVRILESFYTISRSNYWGVLILVTRNLRDGQNLYSHIWYLYYSDYIWWWLKLRGYLLILGRPANKEGVVLESRIGGGGLLKIRTSGNFGNNNEITTFWYWLIYYLLVLKCSSVYLGRHYKN